MFTTPIEIAPARTTGLMQAAEAAVRAVPPAFPLTATVAVNPFLGQLGEDLATASARLARVGGVRLTRPRAEMVQEVRAGRITDADLLAALEASPAAAKPRDLAALKAWLQVADATVRALPTVAELAARETGIDWPGVIARAFGQWAAGHFDRGQALWTPAPGQGAYAAWRAWAIHDLTPEIAGLKGFCARVADAPDTPERAILLAATELGLEPDAAASAFHRLLVDLGGWAQHARWLLWEAELAGGTDAAPAALLAIRLQFETALLAHVPAVWEAWAEVVAAHAEPLRPSPEQVVDAILQEAAERAHQRRLDALMTGGGDVPAGDIGERPAMQAVFCIDVRSEVFRRALESVNPAIETLGFAGFFGLPLAHRECCTDARTPHLPVLLNPALASSRSVPAAAEQAQRISARALRAWGRFRQAAVSSFAFVEAAGPGYAWKLVKDSLRMVPAAADAPAPRFDESLSAERKAATAAAVLKAMSLTRGHGRLVVLLGHGAQVTNNPHESAYHCGACGGQTGEVSARLLAQLLNDPETRAGLPAEGVALPDDCLFVAGLHDTTTDEIRLYADTPSPGHAADLAAARGWFAEAAARARVERAARLPGARASTIAARARDWAEIRPEWGLAGCAAFIAAPRAVTRRRSLEGRAFLHSYDWRADAGFGTLELILTAPVVVASWISLQYYGSSVAPDLFGGGNKLVHNVVGGFGVVEGNGGRLRAGLPWQTVHDGERLVHEPLRLSVMVEAPRAAIADVLARHAGVRALFDNGWLHLFVLEDGRIVDRYRPGVGWTAAALAA